MAVAGVVVGILSLVVAVVGLSLERRSRRNDLRRLEQQERTRRRAEVTLALRQEYILSHDGLSPGIIAGTEPIPAEWLDARLAQLDRDLGTVRELPAVSGVVVERVIEGDGDRLEVFGTVDGVSRVGYGWKSALTNYLADQDVRDEQGNHLPGYGQTRQATEEEAQAYYKQLLTEAAR